MTFNARAAASIRRTPNINNKNLRGNTSVSGAGGNKDDVEKDASMSLLLVDKTILEAFATNFADTIAFSIGGFTGSQKGNLIKTIVVAVSNYLCDHAPQYNSNAGFKEWTKLDGGSVCDEVVQKAFTKFMVADNNPSSSRGNNHNNKSQQQQQKRVQRLGGLKQQHQQRQKKIVIVTDDKENSSNKDIKGNNNNRSNVFDAVATTTKKSTPPIIKPRSSYRARVDRCRKFQEFYQQQNKGTSSPKASSNK